MLETLLSSVYISSHLLLPPKGAGLFLHLTDEETEVPSGNMTLWVTRPARGGVGIQTPALGSKSRKALEKSAR